jgi:Tfp pilus assembly protein PilX
MVLLSLLGVTLLTVAATEHSVAFNALWSEGALMAAEAGVNRGLNQLSANAQSAAQAIPDTPVATGYSYRSGARAATTPQQLQYISKRSETGYSLAQCSDYNECGYSFYTYQITATGTGPRNALREVDVQAEYGPVP